MMGEFVSDDKEVSKHLPTEKPRPKRSYAMFRECDPGIGGGYADGRVIKRMKESDHKTIHHLTEYKPATDNNNDKWRLRAMGSDESNVKKNFNQCDTAKRNDSLPSAHMGVRRSAGMLKLPPLSPSSPLSSPLEKEVVRDGPKKMVKQKLSITPENYQSEEERIKSFDEWPLNETVHPEQLARVGFVYTGDGALVQCFQCGVKYRHWYKGDVPLNVHQKCNPHCPFLLTLTGEDQSSSIEQIPPQPLSESHGQFPYCSDQAARTGVKPFLQHSGTQDRHVVGQNWEGSDNDELSRHSPNHSLIASGKMCVAKLERGNTSELLIQSTICSRHSDGLDNSTKYFRSPIQSLSGSPRTPRRSERFAMEGGLQETESSSSFSNTICHFADYSIEGAEQRMIRSNTVVTGVHSATVFRQDPLSSSSITSADLQLEIAVHSLDSEHISSGRTAMHGGDGIGATISQTCCSPNLRQNQQLSSSGSPQVSRKISDSDDESFCSAQSDVDTTLMSLDPAKTTVMYEER